MRRSRPRRTRCVTPRISSRRSKRIRTPASSRSADGWSIVRISFRPGAFWNAQPGSKDRVGEAVHPVPPDFDARIGPTQLAELHDLAKSDPDRFWLDQARRLTWNTFPSKAGDWSFDQGDFHIRWYEDGELNLSVNCLDRHLAEHADRTALIFEADEPGEGDRLTYRQLYEETCRFATLLKSRGIKRGDRVMIYMPMIPE